MHLVAVLVRELNLRRDLHVSILLLGDQELLIRHYWSGHRAARSCVAVLSSGEVRAPGFGLGCLVRHDGNLLRLGLGLLTDVVVFNGLTVILR